MKVPLPPRIVPGVGEANIILDVYQEADSPRIIGAIDDLKGRINLPPKAWLALVRSELKIIEDEARKARCTELRMVGRFTQKMFPDYEPYTPLSGLPGLRKAL
jgi:hypothetical protein